MHRRRRRRRRRNLSMMSTRTGSSLPPRRFVLLLAVLFFVVVIDVIAITADGGEGNNDNNIVENVDNNDNGGESSSTAHKGILNLIRQAGKLANDKDARDDMAKLMKDAVQSYKNDPDSLSKDMKQFGKSIGGTINEVMNEMDCKDRQNLYKDALHEAQNQNLLGSIGKNPKQSYVKHLVKVGLIDYEDAIRMNNDPKFYEEQIRLKLHPMLAEFFLLPNIDNSNGSNNNDDKDHMDMDDPSNIAKLVQVMISSSNSRSSSGDDDNNNSNGINTDDNTIPEIENDQLEQLRIKLLSFMTIATTTTTTTAAADNNNNEGTGKTGTTSGSGNNDNNNNNNNIGDSNKDDDSDNLLREFAVLFDVVPELNELVRNSKVWLKTIKEGFRLLSEATTTTDRSSSVEL